MFSYGSLIPALTLLTAAPALAVLPVQYHLQPLDVPASPSSYVWRFNTQAQAAGYTLSTPPPDPLPTFWSGPDATVLSSDTIPGFVFGQLSSLNETGVAVGYAYIRPNPNDFASGEMHGLIYHDGVTTVSKNPLQYFAVNNAGQIAGIDASGPFVADGPTLRCLPGPLTTNPIAINDRGQVVGRYIRLPDAADGIPATIAFIADSSGFRDLLPLSGTFYSAAAALNHLAQVVGASQEYGGPQHATLWLPDGTPLPLLGFPGDTYSHAADINDAGLIVGGSSINDPNAAIPTAHALLWHVGDPTPVLVADLLDNPDSSVNLTDVFQILPDDSLVALGYVNATPAYFLLTPVPEPTVPVLASLAAPLALRRSRRTTRP